MWLLSVYNSYKYARKIPIYIADYWLLSFKCLARTVFFVLCYRLSIVKYRILIIDRANHHSTVNCHKLVLFCFLFINICIIYTLSFFFFFDMFASNACHENTFALYWCYYFYRFFSSICLVIQLHKYEYSKYHM